MTEIRIQKIDGQEFVTYMDYLRLKEENKAVWILNDELRRINEKLREENQKLKEEKQELEYLWDINEELKEENKKLKERVKELEATNKKRTADNWATFK
jgi:regulator of replication initiation timing